ncbi:MAG TPA: N-formylglutamate amidohydrolase [Afifellaceae bacterium]|nr:N-formylglutamate amidohydrolase [Afifellaceae bacterium]
MSADASPGEFDGDSSNSHEIVDGDKAGGLIILCDHASNALPDTYGDLGVERAELERHIGYDIGVEALGRALARRFRAPAVLSRFSRLLIDPNRGEDDPTLIMRLSDGAVVPGNARVDDLERERRLNLYYRPYHTAVTRLIDDCLAAGRPPVLLSLHSYTAVWRGSHRPWHCGLLWDRDPRLAEPMITRLALEAGLRVGDNEPYSGSLKNDTMYRHGTSRGLAHGLLEVRNDLIEDPAGILQWTDRLEAVLRDILPEPSLYEIRHYGSLSDEADYRPAPGGRANDNRSEADVYRQDHADRA